MTSDIAAEQSDPQPTPPSSAPAKKHPWRTTIIILLLLALVGYGIGRIAKIGSAKSGARPTTAVGVGKAETGDMPVRVTALGTVQPIVTATVRTQLSGVLFKLLFTEGQMVREGQVLAQIDPRPYRLALAQAQANLARDNAQLAAAQVDLTRYQTLLRQDSIASQQVDTQRATVHQLIGTVAADRAAIGTAKLNLDYTAVQSPITGRVGIRQVDIGNYLTPSDTNGIVIVTQLAPIDVAFSLPQIQLGSIGRAVGSGSGMSVQARGQNDNALITTGAFLTFDNEVDPTTGTVKAKARFTQGAEKLFPGEFVNISMLTDTLKNVVTVPVAAVRHGAPGDFVFLLQPGRTVKLTKVKIGPSDGTRTAILSGLTTGATVVIEGADGLEDGAKVRLPGDKGPGGGGSANNEGGAKASGKGHRHHKSSGDSQNQ
ncbi:MAG TPA: efflux RND transporter periplasmic adaptor subunit [Sphingobium sp.]|uniref:efflux RND transporter periplasmic adaptor subunit n=1 Tax=Sphingobium sp. TaxID=1912891 RepID=UPI002ED0DB6D